MKPDKTPPTGCAPWGPCDRLVFLCRVRRQIVRARTRLSNQIDAVDRALTGQTKGKKASMERPATPMEMAAAEAVKGHLQQPFEMLEGEQKPFDKEMEALAKRLPVYPWVESVRGFGPGALAQVVGETGDLSNYANPAKVWKRMGLAVLNGKRQQRIAGTTKEKTAEAIAHGYSPQRRALMYVVGDCLIKQNADGPYRKLYDERKALELARLPEDAKGRQGWAHARASRYMQKRLLVDLWSEWNKAGHGRFATQKGPASPSTPAGQCGHANHEGSARASKSSGHGAHVTLTGLASPSTSAGHSKCANPRQVARTLKSAGLDARGTRKRHSSQTIKRRPSFR